MGRRHRGASWDAAVQGSGDGGDVSGLTCDECSGSLEVGVGGLATCAGCGKKYTREQLPGHVGGLARIRFAQLAFSRLG